jgi:3-oxoacyl-[acyl-carrier protein] reductase
MASSMAGEAPTVHLDATERTTDDDWRRVLSVHLDGTFFCTRAAIPLMGPGAAVVNLGSIMGTSGGAGAPAYCAAKGGILALTRAHARELVTRGIRVNAIAPGWIETSMTDDLGPMRPLIAAQTPMGRMGDVDDIAWCAVYLASDEAKFVTGQTVSPNGGWTMNQ